MRKIFSCYHFAEKTTSKSLSNAFVPKKTIYSTNKFTELIHVFWVCVLRKKCKPQFTQKVNSNLFIFWGNTNTIILLVFFFWSESYFALLNSHTTLHQTLKEMCLMSNFVCGSCDKKILSLYINLCLRKNSYITFT